MTKINLLIVSPKKTTTRIRVKDPRSVNLVTLQGNCKFLQYTYIPISIGFQYNKEKQIIINYKSFQNLRLSISTIPKMESWRFVKIFIVATMHEANEAFGENLANFFHKSWKWKLKLLFFSATFIQLKENDKKRCTWFE